MSATIRAVEAWAVVDDGPAAIAGDGESLVEVRFSVTAGFEGSYKDLFAGR